MPISYQVTDNIVTITLDDGKANALTTQWLDELMALFDKAQESEAKALIITGRQNFFSGGLDIKALSQMDAAGVDKQLHHFATMALKLYGLPMPTIALITGHTIAGGFILASACDHRFALNGPFKYQLNEIVIGVAIPHWLSTVCDSALSRPVFEAATLSARVMSPQDMLTYGFLSGLGEDLADVTGKAYSLASQLAGYSREVYADSKAMMRGERIRQAIAKLG